MPLSVVSHAVVELFIAEFVRIPSSYELGYEENKVNQNKTGLKNTPLDCRIAFGRFHGRIHF